MIYEIIELPFSGYIQATEKNGNVKIIPFDDANSDYQRYLEWLEQ